MGRLVRCAYAVSVLARLFSCLYGTAYLHPDEWIQSVQIITQPADSTSLDYLPWEFQPQFAARSYFPLLVLYWPLLNYSDYNLKESTLFWWYYPRILSFLLSLSVDWLLYYCSRRSINGALLLYSTAWPTLTYLVRPFSNSIETVLIALLCCILLHPALPQPYSIGNKIRWMLVGGLCAFGCFVRITFPAFAAPLVLWSLLRTRHRQLEIVCRNIIWLLIGALPIVVCGILVDTAYFGQNGTIAETFDTVLKQPKAIVFAPLNNLLYNSNPTNLAKHGLHPRWTHLVNLGLLFGPILGLLVLIGAPIYSGLKTPLAQSALVGFAVLSAAPHQEVRFLLPLTVSIFGILAINWTPNSLAKEPSTVQSRRRRLLSPKLKRTFWGFWFVSQLILTLVFGFLHQGGVVPCLISLRSKLNMGKFAGRCKEDTDNTGAIYRESCSWNADKGDNAAEHVTIVHFWKLYTPPTFFLNQDQINTTNHKVTIIDETGKSRKELRNLALQSHDSVPLDRFYWNPTEKRWRRDWLVTPAWLTRDYDSSHLLSVERCGDSLHLGFDELEELDLSSLYLRINAFR